LQAGLAAAASPVSQGLAKGHIVGFQDLENDGDEAAERYYSMRLRHALPTAQGVFEAFEGRWVYAHGEHPSAPFGIGDAPCLPGFDEVQEQIDDFASEAAEFVKLAHEAELPLYAHLVNLFMGGSMPPPVHSVGIHETCSLGQSMAAAARAMLRGINTLKIKLDPDVGLEQSIKSLRLIRNTYPDMHLRIDLAGALNETLEGGQDPRSLLEEFAQLRLDYLEDPVDAKLIDLLPTGIVPLALDLVSCSFEQAIECVERRQIDVLVLKPQLCGSFGRAFTLARTARARGVQVVLSSLYDSPVGIATLLHFGVAVGLDDCAHGLNTLSLIYPHPCALLKPGKDGRILIPTGPGLGLGEGPWMPKL
jgi:L-alanine-DL-glutamate epimerase-like enolase superfamily enzyme